MDIWYLTKCLENNFKDSANFRKYCEFVTKCKKDNISYEELSDTVNSFLYIKGKKNIVTTCKNGKSIIIMDEVYKYLEEENYHFRWGSRLLQNYLMSNEKEYNVPFYEYLSEYFKVESCRHLNIALKERHNTDFTVFNNIRQNRNIKNFCKIVDNKNKMNAFEVFNLYKSMYPTCWHGSSKFFLREIIVCDAVLKFYNYSEKQRKSVKFFDYLLTEIVKHYIRVCDKYPDVSELFKHQKIFSCPFCGNKPKISMKLALFDTELRIVIECEDCSHIMYQSIMKKNGIGQPEYLKIYSFSEAINMLIEKWNHRIKNDDMWLEDESLPDELPECEPDMFAKKIYAPGLKHCPFCGSKAAFKKYNSAKDRDGNRKPDGIKTISVVCDKGCFSASYFGTPESVPDKHTIGYMAYRWNQRKMFV